MPAHRLSIFLLLLALTLAACGAPAAAPASGPSDEVIQELVRAKFPLPLVSVTVQNKSACTSAEELWVARVERVRQATNTQSQVVEELSYLFHRNGSEWSVQPGIECPP